MTYSGGTLTEPGQLWAERDDGEDPTSLLCQAVPTGVVIRHSLAEDG